MSCGTISLFLNVAIMSKKPTNPSATQLPDAKDITLHPHDGAPIAVASAPLRLIAIVYDGMLLLALLFLVSVVLVSVGTYAFGVIGSSAADAKVLPVWYQNAVLSPSFVLTIVWFYGVFWRKSGQTLGMQTWRLKTITSDGKLLTWWQSFVRILCACIVPMVCAAVGYLLYKERKAAMISAFFGFLLNYLFCYVNARGLAVQDLLSNTLTVRVAKFHHQGIFASLKARKAK